MAFLAPVVDAALLQKCGSELNDRGRLAPRRVGRASRLRVNVTLAESRSTRLPEPPRDLRLFPYGHLEYTSRNEGERTSLVKYVVDDFNPSGIFAGLDGAGVKVSVLDTGVDVTHRALASRVRKEDCRNFTNDNNGDRDDVTDGNGHGTHCAGIIAAEDMQQIMFGIAPKAELIVGKVLSDRGEAWTDIHNVPLRIAEAIEFSVDQGASVISMSLGLPDNIERMGGVNASEYAENMHRMFRAVQHATCEGVVVVAAAGNDGSRMTNTITPPGQYGEVITVASHDDEGTRSAFSSYGGELDFMAPGEVWSCWPTGLPYRGRAGKPYEHLTGTSMATPLVAGLAALIKQAGAMNDRTHLSFFMQTSLRSTAFLARNNYEVRETLRLLAERPEEHRRDDGYGRLVRAYQRSYGNVPEM